MVPVLQLGKLRMNTVSALTQPSLLEPGLPTTGPGTSLPSHGHLPKQDWGGPHPHHPTRLPSSPWAISWVHSLAQWVPPQGAASLYEP